MECSLKSHVSFKIISAWCRHFNMHTISNGLPNLLNDRRHAIVECMACTDKRMASSFESSVLSSGTEQLIELAPCSHDARNPMIAMNATSRFFIILFNTH